MSDRGEISDIKNDVDSSESLPEYFPKHLLHRLQLAVTLVSWGNAVSDLTSNLAMARDGFPTMALTACFARCETLIQSVDSWSPSVNGPQISNQYRDG